MYETNGTCIVLCRQVFCTSKISCIYLFDLIVSMRKARNCEVKVQSRTFCSIICSPAPKMPSPSMPQTIAEGPTRHPRRSTQPLIRSSPLTYLPTAASRFLPTYPLRSPNTVYKTHFLQDRGPNLEHSHPGFPARTLRRREFDASSPSALRL